ncbi:MAG: hypothetical protein ACRC0A_00020, partial [Chitinophagaceae bacterium]
VIYLDPDIYCFSNFNDIFEKLNNYSIILTPHILTIENNYTGDFWENIFLWSGSFNLGFLALKKSNDSISLIHWLIRILKDECFVDEKNFTATDQKWVDYVPMFFDRKVLLIDRDLGTNVAPWNFYEREFYINANQEIWVKNRINDSILHNIVKFVHFSNYNYLELSQGKLFHHSFKKIYADLDIIFKPYIDHLLKENISKYLYLAYNYNHFDNGVVVSLLNRRIYRRLIDEGNFIKNPFSVEKNSFYYYLKKRKLISKQPPITTHVRGLKQKKRNFLIKLFNGYCRLLKLIVGVDKYVAFIKFVQNHLTLENQVFLYDHKLRINDN